MPTVPTLVRNPCLDRLDQSHFGCRTSWKKFLSRRWSFAAHRLLTTTLLSTLNRVLTLHPTASVLEFLFWPQRQTSPSATSTGMKWFLRQSARDTLHHLRMCKIKVHSACAGGHVHIVQHLQWVGLAFCSPVDTSTRRVLEVCVPQHKCVSLSAD